MIKNLKVVFLAILVFSLAGCSMDDLVKSGQIKEPDIAYVDYKVGRVSDKNAVVNLNFEANNPNSVGFSDIKIDYELFVEDKSFLKGANISADLKAKSKSPITVPVDIVYREMFDSIGSIAQRILNREKSIPVTVKVRIHGKPNFIEGVDMGEMFTFSFETSESVDVPIPVDAAASKAKEELNRFLKGL